MKNKSSANETYKYTQERERSPTNKHESKAADGMKTHNISRQLESKPRAQSTKAKCGIGAAVIMVRRQKRPPSDQFEVSV